MTDFVVFTESTDGWSGDTTSYHIRKDNHIGAVCRIPTSPIGRCPSGIGGRVFERVYLDQPMKIEYEGAFIETHTVVRIIDDAGATGSCLRFYDGALHLIK
jgi:hypothetical protein